MRKQPTQLRAKARVDRILDATDAAIAEGGVANVTMNDLAIRAGVPIGSVYQYFSKKDEILTSLCERHYEALGAQLDDYFKDVRSIADFTRDVRATLNLCWNYTQKNPGYRALSTDPNAWAVMREADWQDSLLNARRMADVLQSFVPFVPDEHTLAFCAIVCDSASSTARFASRFEAMRDALFDQFVEMVESRIYTLLREDTSLQRKVEIAK
jgi:AcrR family transcriptional regulator